VNCDCSNANRYKKNLDSSNAKSLNSPALKARNNIVNHHREFK
jgi:hypothetical protein